MSPFQHAAMRASWHENCKGPVLTRKGTVYVLYNKRLGVLVILLALLATSVGAMTVGMSMASEKLGYDGFCLVTAGTNLMLVVWCVNRSCVAGRALMKSHEGYRRWLLKRCYLR